MKKTLFLIFLLQLSYPYYADRITCFQEEPQGYYTGSTEYTLENSEGAYKLTMKTKWMDFLENKPKVTISTVNNLLCNLLDKIGYCSNNLIPGEEIISQTRKFTSLWIRSTTEYSVEKLTQDLPSTKSTITFIIADPLKVWQKYFVQSQCTFEYS